MVFCCCLLSCAGGPVGWTYRCVAHDRVPTAPRGTAGRRSEPVSGVTAWSAAGRSPEGAADMSPASMQHPGSRSTCHFAQVPYNADKLMCGFLRDATPASTPGISRRTSSTATWRRPATAPRLRCPGIPLPLWRPNSRCPAPVWGQSTGADPPRFAPPHRDGEPDTGIPVGSAGRRGRLRTCSSLTKPLPPPR